MPEITAWLTHAIAGEVLIVGRVHRGRPARNGWIAQTSCFHGKAVSSLQTSEMEDEAGMLELVEKVKLRRCLIW